MPRRGKSCLPHALFTARSWNAPVDCFSPDGAAQGRGALRALPCCPPRGQAPSPVRLTRQEPPDEPDHPDLHRRRPDRPRRPGRGPLRPPPRTQGPHGRLHRRQRGRSGRHPAAVDGERRGRPGAGALRGPVHHPPALHRAGPARGRLLLRGPGPGPARRHPDRTHRDGGGPHGHRRRRPVDRRPPRAHAPQPSPGDRPRPRHHQRDRAHRAPGAHPGRAGPLGGGPAPRPGRRHHHR